MLGSNIWHYRIGRSQSKILGVLIAISLQLVTFQFVSFSGSIFRVPRDYAKDGFLWNCLQSNKGGKRVLDDIGVTSMNPCFDYRHNSTNSEQNMNKYIDDTRDCSDFRAGMCTKIDPCIPCEAVYALKFGERWSRCQSCNNGRSNRNCNFREGIGPYCLLSPDSNEVAPCVTCCTIPAPIITIDGKCL